MQTLGLAGESRRSDGWLKSIFWPTVENAWDVDYLGQQGFWLCVIVALLQIAAGALSANLLVFLINLVSAIVFALGAMGVREANWPAAALVFALYFSGILYRLALGGLPGVLSIAVAAVLLSNLRAAYLASDWRPTSEEEDRPTRFAESWRDQLVDQLPAKVWPVLRLPFFALSVAVLLLSLVALAGTVWQRVGGILGSMRLHP